MSEEILIKAENVSKKFCKDLNLSLFYGLKDLASNAFGSTKARELRKKEFWAVDNISFEVKRGECLGLLGHNGAGKSTLLKVITGLISPDKGRITMKGRVNALIELTAGFNPILTGRENIYNNGAVLGLTEKEIDAKFDEIVAFSELEEFIDTPVQYYSSGMKVRLGFSVAVHTEPDVLILDEVLAVGDAGFRAKSFNKMKEIMKNAAVVFVSHSMPTVSRICSDVLFMRNGKSFYLGNNIHKGIEMYFDEFAGEQANIETNTGADINSISINNSPIVYEGLKQQNSVRTQFGENLELEFDVLIKNPEVKDFHIEIQITDKDLKLVAIHYSNKFYKNFEANKKSRIKLVLPNLELIDGEYSITYMIVETKKTERDYTFLAIYRNYTNFKVEGLNLNVNSSFCLNGELFQDGKPLEKKQ